VSLFCVLLTDHIKKDHYTFAQPGIQRLIYKLQELVARIDAPLAKHLEQQEAQFIQFGFRWMNCLLMRELPLPLIIRMWDTYLSENDGFSTYHVYVCACFLKTWSKQLQQLEFQVYFLLFASILFVCTLLTSHPQGNYAIYSTFANNKLDSVRHRNLVVRSVSVTAFYK